MLQKSIDPYAPPQAREMTSGTAEDPTPNLSRWQEWTVRAVAVVALAYSTYYVFWRWTASINWDAAWFSVPLVVAETYGLITAYFMVFTVWRLKRRVPPPAPEGRVVDVYITCYDEPLDILRRTALGAREITYPHRTFMLDDGKRDEVRALAEDLGIGYIRRPGNEHAKAGNLNHAFKVTDGEFILQLDADHVPLPHILDRLLGFFDDPRVAFVQSPQDFYNTDSFTHDVDEDGGMLWEEQRIFFSLIQPGKDRWNAAFFCGSCGVIRRTAIEEIGGFSVETITEDMETSLILHGRGWKSVYYGESLAYGLAPGSAGAFHVQRLRWGQGSMQILRKFNPLTYPGLSIPQRICYFASVTSYLDGLQKMVLYAAPLLFFFTGVFPIRTTNEEFLVRFVPYLALSILMFEMLARGTGFLWIADRYNMAKFWTYVRAVSGFFARGKLKFNVTPKGPSHVPVRTYAPQLVVAGLTVTAVLWATVADRFGWIDYGVAGWGSTAFLLNFAWAAWNFWLAVTVVRLSRHLLQQREDHRFADRLAIKVRARGKGGRVSRGRVALLEDLNASGLRFRSGEALEEGTSLQLTLPLSTGRITVNGEVMHAHAAGESHPGVNVYGVRLVDVPLPVRDAIELHCTQHAVPIWQSRFRLSLDLFTRAQQWRREARGERRRRVDLPISLSLDPRQSAVGRTDRVGFLEDVSRSGARLIMNEPIAPGTQVFFHVPGTKIRGEGRTIFAHARETPIGIRYTVGVQRPKAARRGLQRLADRIVGA